VRPNPELLIRRVDGVMPSDFSIHRAAALRVANLTVLQTFKTAGSEMCAIWENNMQPIVTVITTIDRSTAPD
jgi:hypothetical protein